MRHENNGLGAMLASIFDGGKGADNPLVVGDFLVAVQRDIEVHLAIGKLEIIPGMSKTSARPFNVGYIPG